MILQLPTAPVGTFVRMWLSSSTWKSAGRTDTAGALRGLNWTEVRPVKWRPLRVTTLPTTTDGALNAGVAKVGLIKTVNFVSVLTGPPPEVSRDTWTGTVRPGGTFTTSFSGSWSTMPAAGTSTDPNLTTNSPMS